ncbi:winged helix-turn-helix transcriptional regulator [Metaclostridioides mangenotii]|uniref:winged helix-turn-helix transcriptional regulator n=1 Tax=Metaclostridioides mangenotii TaxID=1540 RepID=UPI0027D479F2|nr:winged helix-turn-helix transcriptional regulator [Clostridioides mangenotii]
MRYGELRKALESVSNKMLSNYLKVLESDGLIMRTEYAQVPPKVEYSLTETGHSLMPVLQVLCSWGHDHFEDH